MAMDDDHIDLTEHEESDTTEKEVNKASNTDVQIDVSKRPLFKHYVSIKAKDRKDQTAKCIYCNLIFKTPFGTTKTLSDHLKRKHDEAFKTYNADKERLELEKKKRKEESCGAAHPLITTVLKKKKIQWSSKHPKAQALTKKTAQWLVKGFHPYTDVEQPEFLELIEMTEPNYHVPSADNFASVIIPELYNEKKAELKKTIDEDKDSMSSFSFTTDGWTSKAGDSYLGVTGHYLDDDFYFKNMCLGHEKLNGSHTGVNMKNALQIKLAEYNLIPSTIPIYAVSDNAPNIVNALNLLSSEDVDVTRIPCFDHGLNLAVSDVKEQTKNFSNTCAKTRSLVGFFKHSSSARDVFHEVQIERGLPPLELMQDVPTRWNSEFLMLSRLCKVREPLSIAIGRLKDSPVEDLTTREWSVVESYVNVLRPLYDATVTMSAENKPTISSVIPTLSTVEDILTGIVSTEIGTTPSKTLAKNLKLQIQSRFPNYTEDKIYVISMMLDPRYKDMLIDSSKKNRWVEVIKTEANKMAEALAEKAKKASQVTATPSTSQVNAPSSSTTPATSLRASMKRVLSQKTSQSEMSVKSLLDLELGHYFAEAPIGLDDDPLKFWRESRSKYPLLRPVAKKYLGIPASQCACERQNSTGTNVVTARRRRLTPLHVEQLVFLHENL